MNNVQEWFHGKEWGDVSHIQAHASINVSEFYKQYNAQPDRWQKVFDFLKQDLKSLEVGKYPLEGNRVIAIVSEYDTKILENAKWEAHKKYIDLLYVIDGQELMGLLPLRSAVDQKEYNDEKDVVFFGEQDGEYFTANPDFFFLFFPEDVHRPCIQVENSTLVKKLVVKIAVAE